jgi:hypothetical protein
MLTIVHQVHALGLEMIPDKVHNDLPWMLMLSIAIRSIDPIDRLLQWMMMH